MSTTAIDASGLSKSFGQVKAVRDMSLTIRTGEVVALLGPNGAGKTTSIDLMLGLQTPDAGTSRLFGMSPADAISRNLVGAVQQDGAMNERDTVRGLLRFVAGMMPHPIDIDHVMQIADIAKLANRRIYRCSGGEKQRIRLALALLPDPLLLFLDEPTAGMDVRARHQFWRLMREWAKAGRAIVFATHYLAEAQNFAQRIVIINQGRKVTDEPTERLRELYAASTLQISYDCPDEDAAAAVRGLPGADRWDIDAHAGNLSVHGQHLDDAARAALALPGAHDLSLSLASVEDAYLSLTRSDDNAAQAAAAPDGRDANRGAAARGAGDVLAPQKPQAPSATDPQEATR